MVPFLGPKSIVWDLNRDRDLPPVRGGVCKNASLFVGSRHGTGGPGGRLSVPGTALGLVSFVTVWDIMRHLGPCLRLPRPGLRPNGSGRRLFVSICPHMAVLRFLSPGVRPNVLRACGRGL